MNNKLIIHHISTPLVVLQDNVLQEVTDLVARAMDFQTVTADNYDQANAIYAEVTLLNKKLEAECTKVKKPVLELGKQIDAAVIEAAGPLTTVKKELEQAIAIEYRRQKAEEQKKLDEIAAQQKAAAKELERARLAGQADAVLLAQQELKATTIEKKETVEIAKTVTHTVSIKLVKKLEIYDQLLIPQYIETQSGRRWLLLPDEYTIKRLLEAGLSIAGCRLIEVEQVGSR